MHLGFGFLVLQFGLQSLFFAHAGAREFAHFSVMGEDSGAAEVAVKGGDGAFLGPGYFVGNTWVDVLWPEGSDKISKLGKRRVPRVWELDPGW